MPVSSSRPRSLRHVGRPAGRKSSVNWISLWENSICIQFLVLLPSCFLFAPRSVCFAFSSLVARLRHIHRRPASSTFGTEAFFLCLSPDATIQFRSSCPVLEVNRSSLDRERRDYVYVVSVDVPFHACRSDSSSSQYLYVCIWKYVKYQLIGSLPSWIEIRSWDAPAPGRSATGAEGSTTGRS